MAWDSMIGSVSCDGNVPPSSWHDATRHFAECLNNPWYNLVLTVQSTIVRESNRFFEARNFAPVLMPITCGSVSSPMGLGSDSLPVKVRLFHEETYLADSMQFQLEYLTRISGGGVYYIMPTFRGEDPDQTHLNQFFHSEAEMKGGLDDVMELIEAYIKALSSRILADLDSLLAPRFGVEHIVDVSSRSSFPRCSFADAVKILNGCDECFEAVGSEVMAISNIGELRLIEHFGGIVWLTHFPKQLVPFYQATDSSGNNALCADLLFGIGETVGCGERHLHFSSVLRALDEHQVNRGDYDWYVRMKREAPLRTSGFGLGIERFILWVLRHNDIRDVPLMPRLKGVRSVP